MIDASDENRSNWLRYVNCARSYREQNLVAHQYRGDIYYSSIKTIPLNTELLVFYGCELALELDIDMRIYNTYNSDVTENNSNIKNAIHNAESNITNFTTKTNNQSIVNKNSHNSNSTPDTTKKFHICQICGKNLSSSSSLKRHKLIHFDYKPFECTYCDFKTNKPSILQDHINCKHTKNVSYKCEFCGQVYYIKRSLEDHRRKHLN